MNPEARAAYERWWNDTLPFGAAVAIQDDSLPEGLRDPTFGEIAEAAFQAGRESIEARLKLADRLATAAELLLGPGRGELRADGTFIPFSTFHDLIALTRALAAYRNLEVKK